MASPRFTQELSRAVLPAVQFDGVCLKTRDARPQATFWQLLISGVAHERDAGRYHVEPGPGRPRHEIVRIQPVPSLSPERSRVHFDVRLPGPDPAHLLAAGARLVREPGIDPWYVLADAEDNAFCAYPGTDDRPPGIFELVVKSRDAHAQARWWGEQLGGEVTLEGDAAAVVGAPEFPWDYWLFDQVPEPKIAENRMHWHVTLRDPDPSAIVAAGATVLQTPTAARNWWVLADPEGNEFCATAADL